MRAYNTHNTISGKYSSILGGQNNVINHNFAAVFGNGVNTVANNTFHIEQLNANAVPGPFVAPPPLGAVPIGSLFFSLAPFIIPGAKILYIQ